MPRPCVDCTSSRRGAIERDIRARIPVAKIAEAYALADKSGRAVQRHRDNHMDAAAPADGTPARSTTADMARLLELKTMRALVEAEASPNPRIRAAALRQARENLEAASRARASTPPDYSALRDPIVAQLRDRLAAALRPFPEAAAAAVRALTEER